MVATFDGHTVAAHLRAEDHGSLQLFWKDEVRGSRVKPSRGRQEQYSNKLSKPLALDLPMWRDGELGGRERLQKWHPHREIKRHWFDQ